MRIVVAGANAKFKGTGTIGGDGDYGFMITAADGQANGDNLFRTEIWDKATDNVVYDNKLGEADDSSAGTAITAGNIIAHKGGDPLQAAEVLGISPRTADRAWAYGRAWLRNELAGS